VPFFKKVRRRGIAEAGQQEKKLLQNKPGAGVLNSGLKQNKFSEIPGPTPKF